VAKVHLGWFGQIWSKLFKCKVLGGLLCRGYKGGFVERLMCLKVCSEMNIGRSIKCLKIYDEGRFIFMELGKYCKESGIE